MGQPKSNDLKMKSKAKSTPIEEEPQTKASSFKRKTTLVVGKFNAEEKWSLLKSDSKEQV